jgi:Methyltransferase FkbM domain
VPLRSIDALVNSKKLPKMQYIKLDVEGAELESLRGARESIRRFRPKLAVSLYHKPNDLFELILYVASNFPFYKCHIDHYTIHMEETVLYCQA